jgi:ribosome-associated protein YbcJ (S4-like RNA binding protein)
VQTGGDGKAALFNVMYNAAASARSREKVMM